MGFDARQESLTKAILKLSLPAIVTNITVPLLGFCDIAIAGHRGGAPFIASLAVATNLFSMIFWLFGFLRMGTSGLTAVAFGREDLRGATIVLHRSLLIGSAAGILMIALASPLCSLLLRALDVEGETAAMARRYFMIVVWAAPAVLCNYGLTGWFIGMQTTRLPMIVSIVADIVNIVLSVWLVFGLNWHIEGVAAGTLTAHWTAFATGVMLAARSGKLRPSRLRDTFARGAWGPFFRINRDIFLRTLCLVAVTMWFTRAGATQGEMMLAVNALLMQLFTIFSYFMDGFAFSAEALAGRFIGANDRTSLRATIKLELIIGLCVALLFTTAYFFGGEAIFRALTDDEGVVAAALDYRLWGVTIPLAGFMAFSCDGIFIGATLTGRMLLSMAVAMGVFFGVWTLLSPLLGNHALWLAFVSYLLMRGLILVGSLGSLTGQAEKIVGNK